MKTEVRQVTLTCDGCGSKTGTAGAGKWRHISVTVTGGVRSIVPHTEELDYCPSCQKRVVLPGVRT